MSRHKKTKRERADTETEVSEVDLSCEVTDTADDGAVAQESKKLKTKKKRKKKEKKEKKGESESEIAEEPPATEDTSRSDTESSGSREQ